MGRELRKVPANWEHPKDGNGNYIPMENEFYGDVLNEWFENHRKWEDGTHEDLIERPQLKEEYPFYAMYHGDPPNVDDYQIKKFSEDELTHIQLYETTSEGTPKSPVFPKEQFEQLCEWAATNATTFGSSKATKEQWMKMLKDDFVYAEVGNVMFC